MLAKTLLRRLEVHLTVDHPRFSSAELEKLLALHADERWDAGQRYRPSPDSAEQSYQFSRWALREFACSLDELTEATHNLALRVQKIEHRFSLLPSDADITLTLFVTEVDTVMGFGFDTAFLKLLGRINAGVEVSLVVSPPMSN